MIHLQDHYSVSIKNMNAILLFSLALLHFPLTSADDSSYRVCGTTNYTSNSTYDSNLKILFSSLYIETTIAAGFSKITIGVVPNQISGLFLCRGDVNSSVCGSCLNQSFAEVLDLCPYNKEATIYYDHCLLRYSNIRFLNSTDQSLEEIFLENTHEGTFNGWDQSKNATNSYLSKLNNLLNDVSNWAAYDSIKRFGTGEIRDSFTTFFGLAQCDPDMSSNDCRKCLEDLIGQMLQHFDGSQGGRILGFLCNLRYEIYSFFYGDPIVSTGRMGSDVTPTPAVPKNNSNMPPVETPPTKGGIGKNPFAITSIIMALLLCVCFIFFLWIKKRRDAVGRLQEEGTITIMDEADIIWSEERSSKFPLFSQIVEATNNFSSGNKLGQGGFGPVYKGVLPDGLEIAVKRLSAQSGQGLVEFKNEIQLIARLQHKNLVRLFGWCIHGEEKILIYEFMPNKSLDLFIFDKLKGVMLNWEKRFVIIEGIAQGLLYLHKHSRLRIIHRDMKASNILLDSEMIPKISDFGLARIFGPKELEAETNRVVGTYGYMAPEYASEGHFSIKSDVFSFGVLLLEIVSGKRNTGFHQFEDFLNLIGYIK